MTADGAGPNGASELPWPDESNSASSATRSRGVRGGWFGHGLRVVAAAGLVALAFRWTRRPEEPKTIEGPLITGVPQVIDFSPTESAVLVRFSDGSILSATADGSRKRSRKSDPGSGLVDIAIDSDQWFTYQQARLDHLQRDENEEASERPVDPAVWARKAEHHARLINIANPAADWSREWKTAAQPLVAWSPDRRTIVYEAEDELIFFSNTERVERFRQPKPGRQNGAFPPRFLQGGRFFGYENRRRDLNLVDVYLGRFLEAYPPDSGMISAYDIAPDGSLVGVGTNTGIVTIHAAGDAGKRRARRDFGSIIGWFGIAEDGKRAIVATESGTEIVRFPTLERIHSLDLETGIAYRAQFLHGGRRVALIDTRRRLTLWDTATGKELASLEVDGGLNVPECLPRLIFGRERFLLGFGENLVIHDAVSGALLRTIPAAGLANRARWKDAAGDPEGAWVAASSPTRVVAISPDVEAAPVELWRGDGSLKPTAPRARSPGWGLPSRGGSSADPDSDR